MPQESQKIRIQNLLVNTAKTGKFFKTAYDKATGQQQQIDFLTSTALATPKSALCNETLSNFANDPMYGIAKVDKRSTWTFELMIDFDEEVNAEYFEEQLIRTPLILAPDNANGLRQVTLHMTRNLPAHPVLQASTTGTKLRLAFNAEVGRM